MIPFSGFMPDVDPATPGIITDCTQLIPTPRGMQAAPSAVDAVTGLAALAAPCRGAVVVTNTTGSRRTFAGAQTALYELVTDEWVDSGEAYVGSSENRWSFAQFGDATIATNDTEQMQAATSGDFAAIATAPKARIVVSVPNFVMALNTNDASGAAAYGDAPDRWWCSGYQDHTVWTPAVATQCTTGRLVGGGGEITAGASFGSGLVVYKAREMFLGQYAGPPTVFDFQRIPGEQGCVGPEAVVDIGGAHIFVGEDNIWLYDGSRPIPIAEGQVTRWFYNQLSPTYRYRTIVTYDRNNGRVWVFYPSTLSTGNPDAAIVYHLATKRWGRANRTIEAALNFVTPGITWDSLDTVGASWDALPDSPWDSQAWQVAGRALAVFDSTHALKSLTGAGEPSGLTTSDIGDDDAVSTVKSISLRFYFVPDTGAVAGSVRSTAGEAGTTTSSGTYALDKFDIRQTARWHRFAFQFTGNVEVGGIRVASVPAGVR